MSTSNRTLLALCAVALFAACAKKQEPVYVEQPVTQEPVFHSKYK